MQQLHKIHTKRQLQPQRRKWQQWRQQPEAASRAPSLWSRASPELPLLGGSPAASDACNQPFPRQLDDSCDLDASHLDWLGGEQDQMQDMLDLAGELGLLSPPQPSSPTAGHPPASGGTSALPDCGLLGSGGQQLTEPEPEPELMSVFSGGLDILPSGPLPQLEGPPVPEVAAQPAAAPMQPALPIQPPLVPGDSEATQLPAGRPPRQARQQKRRRSPPQQPPVTGAGGGTDALVLPPLAGAPPKPRRQPQPRKRKSPAQQAPEEQLVQQRQQKQPQQGKRQKAAPSAQEQQAAPGRKPPAGRKRPTAPPRRRRSSARSAASAAEDASVHSGPSTRSTAAPLLTDQQALPQQQTKASADALLAEMLGVLEEVQAEKRQQAQQARQAHLAWQAQYAQQARQARVAQLAQQAEQLWQAPPACPALGDTAMQDAAELREGNCLAIVTPAPLSTDALLAAVADDGAGAIATFTGVTRNSFQGKPTEKLEYEAYVLMAAKKLLELCREACARWKLCKVAIAHRTGTVLVGEASVVIACSSAHRADALEACHWAIDELKATVPIWKKEFFQGGEVWKENEEWRQQQAALRRSAPGRQGGSGGGAAAAERGQQQQQQQEEGGS
ncbi:Molybdopterin synthase catalytic subunit [Chlorella sorokiniana]|uniref:Molybdopterin synthase catalytic subunit n=1 Tax=Chlorella sorokiniana TaxID=3076 RepID=A0A2P6TFD2_CHLSO|nr:Molybdopterin synthase catalytic subunit [Chlorella sorokiniana]|eukprot:PRW32679.1 Molybdopterin synthase catalytic subunit [Chlorella sorokiniana]